MKVKKLLFGLLSRRLSYAKIVQGERSKKENAIFIFKVKPQFVLLNFSINCNLFS